MENTRRNAETDPDFRKLRDDVTSNAQYWMKKSNEELWSMIPGQNLPRTIDVTWDYNYPKNPQLGCLKCGKEINNYGNYPYEPDFDKKPWKLTCPSCGIVFPTNDFGAFYKSGIDETGEFNPAKADRKLLFNTEHPDPKDPLHLYGVDDGMGYIDANGRAHKFIGYYGWKMWRHIYNGVALLADSYRLTGDKKYAVKAAIMLDRIADVYPAMDWKKYGDLGWYHSDGSRRTGKIEGSIWETGVVTRMVKAYDMTISGTVDAPEIYEFLGQKAKQFKLPGTKGTREGLIANIDKGLLEAAAQGVKNKQIFGNQGMHQATMTNIAVALDTEPKTGELLDWVFDPKGGALPTMAVQLFDRDGMADEAAPHYCYLWPGKILELMNLLEPYKKYDRHRLSRDYPTLVNVFRAPWHVQLLNTFSPNIGDTGAVGTLGTGVTPELLAAGFKFWGDKESAWNAYQANGYSARGVLRDVGQPTPDTLNNAMETAALAYDAPPRYGEHMPGYGLINFLQGKDAKGKAAWFYYGRNTGHGHHDRLNYSIYAFNTDLTPDMGYPEFANMLWHRRHAWNNNTISHNTVVVDKNVQKRNWTGTPRFYAAEPGFGVAEVASVNVYPQTKEYARTLAFIAAPGDNAYAVDVFRVTGGKDHLLSFHGPPGVVTASGVTMNRQTTGTYAGENVPYGDESKSQPYGYSYLENIERASKPGTGYTFDWKAESGYRGVKATDDIHMRLHVVSEVDDVALGDGVPAPNKPGNPKYLRFALLHRAGEAGLDTQFVTVAEPYSGKAFIEKVTRLDCPESTRAVALKIELAGGVTDYIVSNPEATHVTAAGSGLATNGKYAWVRVMGDNVSSATLTAGTSLSFGDYKLTGPGIIRGTLVRFEKDVKKPANAWVKLESGSPDMLKGKQVYFRNDNKNTGCYDIVAAEADGELVKLTCGPGTFARGFVDDKDYSKGFEYNLIEGKPLGIPVTVVAGASE